MSAKFSRIFISLVFVLGIAQNVFSQDKAARIDDLMKSYSENRLFNGTVLVAENGKIILKKGYGLANMEWNIPNQPDTKFRLGSITKQFTSMLIIQLVADGKIKLDATLADYLPYYRQDTGQKVTIHHLLTHTSGVPSYTSLPNFGQEISRDFYPVKTFVEKYCSGDLEFEPGSRYTYSNSGYFLLGAIIEQVLNKSYEEVLQERILKPLDMKNTGYDHFEIIISHRASGYRKSGIGYQNASFLDMSLPYAAGALYSTVEDLYVWDQALYTEKLLPKKYREIMFTPFLNGYGYGWGVQYNRIGKSSDSVLVTAHGGGINGFTSMIMRLIRDKHLIVLLDNTSSGNLNGIARQIADILYNQPVAGPKKSIADVLAQIIADKNVEEAIKQYDRLKTTAPNDYNFSETELNILGYSLLGEGKNAQAIQVFTLNVREFPNSWNVYDSLGEALLANGDKENAIKNYAKSLELNPKNFGAIRAMHNVITE